MQYDTFKNVWIEKIEVYVRNKKEENDNLYFTSLILQVVTPRKAKQASSLYNAHI